MKNDVYAKRVLTLVFCLSLFNYIDRQVLFAVFPLIKTDLRLSDAQLGFLASSFMIVYMCFAPFVGYLGDRLRRPGIMGVSAMLWSLATAGGGFVRSYMQLIFARSAVGVGEAGFGTVCPSYLAEWFPAGKRARVMAVYALAIPAGSAVGYLLGGLLGQHFGWRNAFFIVALPGLLLGLISFFLKETPEKAGREGSLPFGAYAALFKNRTFLLICLAQSVGTFSAGGLAAWMPSYFVREFGLTVARAGTLFGAVTVAAGITGSYAGGWAADQLRRRTGRGYFIVGYLCFLLSALFGVWAVLATTVNTALALVFCAEFFIFAYYGPYNAAIVETVPAAMRSMAFALNIFIIHALGDAVSPYLVGRVSDAAGLRTAMFIAMIYLLAGGFVSILAGEVYEKDVALKA